MGIGSDATQVLLQMLAQLPPAQKAKVVAELRSVLIGERVERTLKGALFGAAAGAIMEVLPFTNAVFGVDEWVEVGAALGGLIGYMGKTSQEKAGEDNA